MTNWDRQRYKHEYHSYNNMKQRCSKGQGVLSSEFETFDAFMDHIGPKEDSRYTIDRINPHDPEYGPGKVRWASKKVQSNNRRNVKRLTYTGDIYPAHYGKADTISGWAETLGIKPATLYRRIREGRSDNDALEGTHNPSPKTFQQMSKIELLNYKPWPDDTHSRDEERYLDEKIAGETRFEFERRVLVKEELNKLVGPFRRIADDYRGENLSDEPDEMVYRYWVLRDRKDILTFQHLSEQADAIYECLDQSTDEETLWRKALRRYRKSNEQKRAALEIERRIAREDEDIDYESEDEYDDDDEEDEDE